MALTAHFMIRDRKDSLIFKSHLVAFRFIEGAHTGAHLGQEFLKITDDLEISNKVWVVSLITFKLCLYLHLCSLVRSRWTTRPTITHLW